MKAVLKKIVSLTLAMVLVLALALTAQAAEVDLNYAIYDLNVKSGYTLTPKTSDDVTDKADADGKYNQTVKFEFSFPGTSSQYVVFLLSDGATVPSATTIRYIDQNTGTVKYTIYPDTLEKAGTYTVCVSSAAGYVKDAATFKVETLYTLGDVDQDGVIGPYDASLVLQYIAEKTELTSAQRLAADTDRDGEIGPYDASLILQYVAEKIEGF